jgi:hypothetical protein
MKAKYTIIIPKRITDLNRFEGELMENLKERYGEDFLDNLKKEAKKIEKLTGTAFRSDGFDRGQDYLFNEGGIILKDTSNRIGWIYHKLKKEGKANDITLIKREEKFTENYEEVAILLGMGLNQEEFKEIMEDEIKFEHFLKTLKNQEFAKKQLEKEESINIQTLEGGTLFSKIFTLKDNDNIRLKDHISYENFLRKWKNQNWRIVKKQATKYAEKQIEKSLINEDGDYNWNDEASLTNRYKERKIEALRRKIKNLENLFTDFSNKFIIFRRFADEEKKISFVIKNKQKTGFGVYWSWKENMNDKNLLKFHESIRDLNEYPYLAKAMILKKFVDWETTFINNTKLKENGIFFNEREITLREDAVISLISIQALYGNLERKEFMPHLEININP